MKCTSVKCWGNGVGSLFVPGKSSPFCATALWLLMKVNPKSTSNFQTFYRLSHFINVDETFQTWSFWVDKQYNLGWILFTCDSILVPTITTTIVSKEKAIQRPGIWHLEKPISFFTWQWRNWWNISTELDYLYIQGLTFSTFCFLDRSSLY